METLSLCIYKCYLSVNTIDVITNLLLNNNNIININTSRLIFDWYQELFFSKFFPPFLRIQDTSLYENSMIPFFITNKKKISIIFSLSEFSFTKVIKIVIQSIELYAYTFLLNEKLKKTTLRTSISHDRGLTSIKIIAPS